MTTGLMPDLARRASAEAVGTGLLVAIVIGSGIAAQRLSPGNLGMELLEKLVLDIPAGQSIALHPVAVAGWFGLLLTALNLLPLGQLDGGHCLYAASPRLHRLAGAPLSALLLALGVFLPFVGWALWGLITGIFLNHHPPVAEPEPGLSTGRRAVLVISLIIFVLSFTPVPLAPLAG